MTKAEEILRKEITLFEWGKKNDKQLITYEDALKAVNKAINYTHSCKSDSELLHTEVFNLANKLAINGYGNEAIRMHVICNGM